MLAFVGLALFPTLLLFLVAEGFLGAAIDNWFQPTDIIVDEPVSYTAGNGEMYEPTNYDDTFHVAIGTHYRFHPHWRVTAGFGPRLDPRYGTRVPHHGIDLETSPGADVVAVYPGRVVYAAPFLSLFLIHFIVGEEIFPSTVVGLVLIVAGVVIQQYASRTKGA